MLSGTGTLQNELEVLFLKKDVIIKIPIFLLSTDYLVL